MAIHQVMVEEIDLPPDIRWQLMDESKMHKPANPRRKSSIFGSVHREEFPMSNTSSTDSLDLLLEKQRQRQLNHPLHQNHIRTVLGSHLNSGQRITYGPVKETNTVSLEYDPISKRKVLNTYEIIEELGHGQHGKVKLARDLVTKQLVAIKIVNRHKKRTFNDKFSNRFKTPQSGIEDEKIKREIAIMKKCHHEHVVKLIEVLDDAKSRKIYLVLEYCSKGEIKWCPGDVIETKARGPPLLSFQRTREIFRGVLLGLEYLHFQGIIHRDIKPANLLLSEDGIVKISDFGVSLAFSSDSSTDSLNELELAKTAGTPAFFAPEICLVEDTIKKFDLDPNSKEPIISFPTDIWAMGITLHCLLFGMLPFISDYELELFDKIVNEPLVFEPYQKIEQCQVSQVECKEEYEEAQNLLNKLLEKNPKKRMAIQDAKKHPWVCWDFNHNDYMSDQEKSLKLIEQSNFHRSPSEQVEQICISEHEVDTAVGGIGHKIKNAVGKFLPSTKSNDESNTNSVNEFNDSGNNKYIDGCLNSCASYTDNGNLILSEETYISPKDSTGYGNEGTNLVEDSSSVPVHDVSAREIFQQELQRFDNRRDPDSIVSLPVNSSFASLDSFYIDHYAPRQLSEHSFQGPLAQQQKFEAFDRPPIGPFSKPNSNGRVPTQTAFRIPSPNALQLDTLTMGSGISGRNIRSNLHSPILSPTGTLSRRTSNEFPNAALGSRLRKPASLHTYDKNQSAFTNPRVPGDNPYRRSQTLQCQRNTRKPSIVFDGLQESDGDSQSTNSHIEPSNVFQMGSESEDENDIDNGFYLSDNHSDAESLPFEFGIDSEHGSVLSLRDLTEGGRTTTNSYTELRSTNNSSEPPEHLRLFGKHLVDTSIPEKVTSSPLKKSSETAIPIISSDYVDAFTEVEGVPEEMLNMIPEMQPELRTTSSQHTNNCNGLFQQFSSNVLPTTQESSVDHVITMNNSNEAKFFLKNLLSSTKSPRTNSFGNIRSPKLKNNGPDRLATDIFVNHYSGNKDNNNIPVDKGDNENNTSTSRYRSKSVSVGLLADKEADNSL